MTALEQQLNQELQKSEKLNIELIQKLEDIKEEYIVKNLEALENLKTSAKEQNKELMHTIEEIHNQRLDSIQISLTNTLREKLNIFNLNIKEELNQKNKFQLIIMGLVNLVVLIITTIFYLLLQNQMESLQTWQIPLDLQYLEQNQKYIKVPTKEIIQSQDKTTIFIKIKE